MNTYENPWMYMERVFDGSHIGDNFGLFIKLPISTTVDHTLEESIFGLFEHHQERNERLNKKVIGSGITDLVQN